MVWTSLSSWSSLLCLIIPATYHAYLKGVRKEGVTPQQVESKELPPAKQILALGTYILSRSKISSIPSTALSRQESSDMLFCFVCFVFSEARYTVQAGLELETFLPQAPKCWDYRPAAPCQVDSILEKQTKAQLPNLTGLCA